jgi:hypothetical protein
MYTGTDRDTENKSRKKQGKNRHAHAQHGVVRGEKPAAVDDVDKLFHLLNKVARRIF